MNQILSITCDNASNNDEMIRHLEGLVGEFKGRKSQTRCFAHILNLVAKSIIQQFDVPKAQFDKVFDKANAALTELAGDIDSEEQVMAENSDKKDDDEEENTDDWVNERDTMAAEQLAAIDESVRPVKMMLVKVRCVVQYTRRNVTTVTTHQYSPRLLSCARLHLPSKIHPLLSFPDGTRS